MKNQQVADTFYKVAQILELQGENKFKINAYRRGARTISNLAEDIELVAQQGKLKSLPGVGDALAKKIEEILVTDDLSYLKKIGNKLPPTLFDLMRIPGMGPKKMHTLWKTLGIDSIPKLQAACERGEVAKLPRFGKKTEDNILNEILHLGETDKRRPYAEVKPVADAFLQYIRDHDHTIRAEVAGSLRRQKDTVKDIDVLVSTTNPEITMQAVLDYDLVDRVIGSGTKKTSVRFKGGLQVDVRAIADESFACALAYFTGSKDFNVRLRQIALNQGYSLNEYFLRPLDGSKPPIINTEQELHAKLGFGYIPPEKRENANLLN